MLKRIRLVDFKSFADAEVALGRITLLVGANASGKSNFLDALRFLRRTPEMSLPRILNGDDDSGEGSGSWPGLRGGSSEAARAGKAAFSIESTWSGTVRRWREDTDTSTAVDLEATHRIVCQTRSGVRLREEAILQGNTPLATMKTAGGPSLEMEFHDDEERRYRAESRVPTDQSILCSSKHLFIWAEFETEQSENLLEAAFTGIRDLNPQPTRMRGYSALPTPLQDPGARGPSLSDLPDDLASTPTLSANGANLSAVLYRLCESPAEKEALVDWLSELCAPEIVGLAFEKTGLNDVMMKLVERGNQEISARSLSDGTLRFLGVLVGIRTAPPGSVILLEDIDAGLHPTRIKLLVEYLEAAIKRQRIQIIATTHSPALLQWASDETLRDAVVFARLPDLDGTVMRRVGDLPHLDQVLARGGADIGALFSTGWLERDLP